MLLYVTLLIGMIATKPKLERFECVYMFVTYNINALRLESLCNLN